MLSGRRCGFALATLFLILLVLALSPGEARANPIALTAGHYSLSTPFVIPRFIANGLDLPRSTFRASGTEITGSSERSGSNAGFPCLAAATFNFFAVERLDTPDVVAVFNVGRLKQFDRFDGGLQFITQSITIPVATAGPLTLFAPFEMTGSLRFSELDRPLSFSSDVFRAGPANIFLFLSPMAHFYEVQRTDDSFQRSAWPASAALILLSSGLAGFAARPSRRRR